MALMASACAVPDVFGPSEPPLPEANCRAAGAEAFLGQVLDERVLSEARAAAGGMRTRILKPGSVGTTDSDPMRLNIEVDDNNRIRRMQCG